MPASIEQILSSYNDRAPLSEASTIPAPWYVDPRIAELERLNVFSKTWQLVARTDQAAEARRRSSPRGLPANRSLSFAAATANLRAFYNVCRHHAAAVVTQPCGHAEILQCPYHGWKYGLDGSLKGMPEFDGVQNFDRAENGLVPIRVETWECFVFVNLDPQAAPLHEFLGGLVKRVAPLGISKLHYFDRRSYDINCNWKVYVDNFLDGGYHVPHLHKGLEFRARLQAVHHRKRRSLLPAVEPHGCIRRRCRDRSHAQRRSRLVFLAISQPDDQLLRGIHGHELCHPRRRRPLHRDFRFLFRRRERSARCAYNTESVNVGNRVQEEDLGICEDVQRGLKSRAYGAGRLSVRREAGEQLFHRLLAADLEGNVQRHRLRRLISLAACSTKGIVKQALLFLAVCCILAGVGRCSGHRDPRRKTRRPRFRHGPHRSDHPDSRQQDRKSWEGNRNPCGRRQSSISAR